MDKKTAWEIFCATGSVGAYLDYKNAPSEEDYEAEYGRADTEERQVGGAGQTGNGAHP